MNLDPAMIEKMTPEQYTEFILRLRKEMPLDAIQETYKNALAEVARRDDKYENFLAYYELIHGSALPEHAQEPVMLNFEAHAKGEKFMWLGFRGCLKTTTELTLDSFSIGHHPDGTGIVTGASDDNAVVNAKFIATLIEHHPEFKRVFPYVVPMDKAWGADGYWVRRTHEVKDGKLKEISVEEWKQRQSKVIDPTFVGGGYKSSRINGRHPSLFLSVDDLHDIDTSASTVEREYIKQVFFTQILKTIIRRDDKLITRVDITGVPFSKDDAYALMKQDGGTTAVIQPIMKRVAEGTPNAIYIDGVNPKTGVIYDDIVGWWLLAWQGNFGAKSIVNARAEGKGAFWQMMMLDIEIAKTAGLKYYLYPHKDIRYDLPTYGGADPTNVDPDVEVGGKKRSSFGHAWLSVLPQGGLVVTGGTLKPCGIVEAKNEILRAQAMFSNWMTTGVEENGPGKIFMQYLRLDPRVRFVSSKLTNPQGIVKDKMGRFDGEVAPHLESAFLRISDEETPYLMALRNLCDNYFDIDPRKPDERLDAGDALYHAVKQVGYLLFQPTYENLNPKANSRKGLYHPLAGGSK